MQYIMRLPSGPAHRSNSVDYGCVDYRYGVKMAEHRGNTRRATRLAEAQPPMQVIAVSPSRAQVEALAAGSAEAQSKFLEGVGIVTTQVEHLENVLDRESAELLSCALQHQRYKEGRLTDPYFTEEQWKAVVAGRSALLDDAEELVDGILGSSGQVLQNPDKRREWLGRKRKVPLCDCKAHKCDNDEFFTDVLGELVKLQAPLNDNSGTRFANVLLSHILKVATLTRVQFHGTRGGALGPVQYILRLPS